MVSIDGKPTRTFYPRTPSTPWGWWTSASGAPTAAPFNQPFYIICEWGGEPPTNVAAHTTAMEMEMPPTPPQTLLPLAPPTPPIAVNFAVGGLWPKAPDATTPDSATLSVDYVRVWGTPTS